MMPTRRTFVGTAVAAMAALMTGVWRWGRNDVDEEGRDLTFAVDHDGVNTERYDLMIDDRLVASRPAAGYLGTIVFPSVYVRHGTRRVAVRAVGPLGTAWVIREMAL